MKEVAVVVQNDNQKVNAIETIKAIKNSGFKNVFIQWYDKKEWKYSQEEQLKLCKELGLNIIFAHLGYQNINDIWREGKNGDDLVERFKRNIKECKENNIDLVIMHVVGSKNTPIYGRLGIDRLKGITQYAKKLGVKVAFENTKVKGYLEYVLENIKEDNVGICFDAGHCHAFYDDEFNFENYKDKIFAVHLHDNDKSDDLHLIPFDGTVNWKNIIENLRKANYQGPVTLELCYRYDYLNLKIDDFYKKGYDVGIKLAQIFD